jgi:hypothetical protein
MQHWRPSRPTRVKLEGSVDHDDGSRMTPGLITHVSQGFCASDKKAAAQTALISNDPIAAAVLTEHKDLWPLTGRRFGFCCFFLFACPQLIAKCLTRPAQVVLYGFSISVVIGKRARDLRIEFAPSYDRDPD